MQGQTSKRIAASQGNPCPVCGATSKCSEGEDGLILCRKARGEVAGFKHLGTSKSDPQWQMYRREDDPLLYTSGKVKGGATATKGGKGKVQKKTGGKVWILEAQKYASAITQANKSYLADLLQLPLHALDALPLLGYHAKDDHGPCFTFPECGPDGEVVGLKKRYPTGRKYIMEGGHAGLTLPLHWGDAGGPLVIAEGATCTLALCCMGIDAIGRPNDLACVGFLCELLVNLDTTREVIVMGEYDPKPDGKWPGLAGCQHVAGELARHLGRPISWALPPGGHKDSREWFVEGNLKTADSDTLERAGDSFLSALQRHPVEGSPRLPEGQQEGLSTHTADTIKPKVLKWLVPGYFPRGKTILLAGESGQGKSLVMLYLAACLSTGRAIFNLAYTPPPAGRVIYLQCEDCEDDTVLPRLLAAGADLSKIHLPDGVRTKGGKILPFSFAYLDYIRDALEQWPDTIAMFVEPVNAFLSGTEIDAFKSESVRSSLMNPLKDLGDRFATTFFLLKHFNKGGGSSAKARVADSAAFVETARASFAMMPDPDDDKTKLFLELKCNLAGSPQGLKYRTCYPSDTARDAILESVKGDVPADELGEFANQLRTVEFFGETDYSANDLVKEADMPARDTTFEQGKAAAWLRRYLASGPKPATECHENGNEECELNQPLKWWRDKVLRSIKGDSKKPGFQQPNYWLLPGQHLENLSESRESSKTPKKTKESSESSESEEGALADEAFPSPPSS